MRLVEGELIGHGYKPAIVASRFNSAVVNRLIDGAIDSFTRHGIDREAISVYKVPGAFEIPSMVAQLLKKCSFNGIVALGAIVRGETPHFDYIASETSKGIAQLAITSDIPITLGVLTTDTMEQAADRAGGKMGNKGAQSAAALIEMMNLYKQL